MPSHLVLVLAALVIVTAPASAEPARHFDHSGLARRVLSDHLRPLYAELAAAGRRLEDVMSSGCERPDLARRLRAEAAFDGFVAAWGRVEHIDFGPVALDNRRERILFWPDRRGIGAQQLARVFETRDASVLEPTALAARSVALQGLGALEIVLFATTAPMDEAERSFRCGFAAAIAVNLAAIGGRLAEEWARPDGFAAHWLALATDVSASQRTSETTIDLGRAFDRAIDRLREQRIVGPLGLTKQRKKLPSVFQASGRTMRLLAANAEGLLHLYAVGGMQQAIVAAGPQGTPPSVASRARQVASDLRMVREITRGLVGVRTPFADERSYRRIVATGFPLKSARFEVARLLQDLAGVPVGFAADGD